MVALSNRSARVAALLMLSLAGAPLVASAPAQAQVSVGISVNIAPPALPVYVQPPLPGPGYIWTPGYWAWDPVARDHYWVPGAWVLPPRAGILWTPGYWGWVNGAYLFHGGYWGPTVGFYGGVNYGFGYTATGFYGGQWRGGQFYYNSSVNNVRNVNVTNVYSKTVVVNNTTNVSFNGGPNGTSVKPTAEQLAAAKEPHIQPTAAQLKHASLAKADPKSRFSANHGRPANAAVGRPLGGNGQETGHERHEEKRDNSAEHKELDRAGEHKDTDRPKDHKDMDQHPEHKAMDQHPEHKAMDRPHPQQPHPHPGPHPGGCRGPHCH